MFSVGRIPAVASSNDDFSVRYAQPGACIVRWESLVISGLTSAGSRSQVFISISLWQLTTFRRNDIKDSFRRRRSIAVLGDLP